MLPEEPVYRELDAGTINRMFSDIISNALKYSGGDLFVVIDTDGSITFTNTAHHLNAVIVSRLFDRFYTAESGSHSTVLVLSITKMIIERMSGSISARYQNKRLYVIVDFS